MVPFIIIYLFNWVIFFAIFWSLLRKKASKAEKSASAKLKQNLIIAVTLSLLFGLGWGIGLVATTRIPVVEISYTLQTLFVLLTSFQGLWVFIMNCVRSEEARKQWKSWVFIITCRKVSLETKKSITGHVSSGYDKGTHGKYNKYSTLSTAQTSGSQTMQRILKREMNSSIVSSDVIDNENSVFTPTLDPVGEEKKIDLSSDALAVPAAASNPFVPIDEDDNVQVNHSAFNAYKDEIEMKATKLDSLAIEVDGKLKSETNSLHSVRIISDSVSEHADSKSIHSQVNNEFDILWIRNKPAGSNRSSLQVEDRRSTYSDHGHGGSHSSLQVEEGRSMHGDQRQGSRTSLHVEEKKSIHGDQGKAPGTGSIAANSHTNLSTTSLDGFPATSPLEVHSKTEEKATSQAEEKAASQTEQVIPIHIDSPAKSPTSEGSSSPDLINGNENIPLIDYNTSSDGKVVVPLPDKIEF